MPFFLMRRESFSTLPVCKRLKSAAVAVIVLAGVWLPQTPVWADGAPTPPDNMVYVPAGDFTMGTDNSDSDGPDVPLNNNDERPMHTATTRAFFIDKTPVTNAQYKKFCDATHYPVPPQWENGTFPDGQDNYPVVRVSYYEAVAYAKWVGKRLPTEIEWEKAARGTDGRRFPWGDDWDESKVVSGMDGPIAVGQRPDGASPYGALDMSGNVNCWTSSWFEAYPGAPLILPSFGEKFKVVRGGPFMGGQNMFQTFYRSVCRPTSKTEWIGIRCVEDAP